MKKEDLVELCHEISELKGLERELKEAACLIRVFMNGDFKIAGIGVDVEAEASSETVKSETVKIPPEFDIVSSLEREAREINEKLTSKTNHLKRVIREA